LRKQDLRVPTRGHVKDIGKGVSHKVPIVGDYTSHGHRLRFFESLKA